MLLLLHASKSGSLIVNLESIVSHQNSVNNTLLVLIQTVLLSKYNMFW